MVPRYVVIAAAALLVAVSIPTGAAVLSEDTADEPRHVIVFTPGHLEDVRLAVNAAGGSFVRGSDAAGIALVHASPDVVRHLARSAVIASVEPEGRVKAAGTEWDGTEWDGTEWDGTEWDGTEWDGTEWDGTEWDGTEWDGTEWDGTEWDGTEWDGWEWDWHVGPDPGLAGQWGLYRINAAPAWQLTTGSLGATICIVDTGLDVTHRDIQANLWRDPATGAAGWNALDGSTDLTDEHGHGTHVAGIAAGYVGNAWGIAGVGNVRIMAVKALAADTAGREGDVALGVTWCAEHDADVILLSLTSDHLGNGLAQALKFAADHDAVIVSSAGNTGECQSCVTHPARSPWVIAVSATTGSDALAPFSARGPQVELSAPGVRILGPTPDASFTYASGTSQAAALVAGAAALVRDANPHLTADETRALLHETAEDLGKPGRDRDHGFGLVDVGAAVGRALAP